MNLKIHFWAGYCTALACLILIPVELTWTYALAMTLGCFLFDVGLTKCIEYANRKVT